MVLENLKWSDWAEILTGDVFLGAIPAKLFRNVKILSKVRKSVVHCGTCGTISSVVQKCGTKCGTQVSHHLI